MRQFSLAVLALSIAHAPSYADQRPAPEKFSKAEIAGDIFKRPDVIVETQNGRTTEDVLAFMSSDKTFTTGMYKAPAGRFEIMEEDYGVDEFMYFIEGGVTLTSLDGTVTEIKAGDAVTIAKEWRGVWDTPGYTKIYVIYDTNEQSE